MLEDIGTKTFKYLYDFGDGWEHTIKVERLADPEPGLLYPRLIEVSGRCPPEDCGGPWGYAEFLEAIKDPKHERHAELTEWIGDDFDPDADETEWLTARSRRSRQQMVAQTRCQAPQTPLTCGLHRTVTVPQLCGLTDVRGRVPTTPRAFPVHVIRERATQRRPRPSSAIRRP